MGFPWNKGDDEPKEIERTIYANDSERNASFNYANNYVTTSKYTWYSFLPKNLFEQFQRLANFYFLCLAILQFMPVISSLTPATTVLPLIFVLLVSGLKEIVDDYYRHKFDNTVNARLSSVVVGGEIKQVRWDNVQVGDIICMKNGESIAADLLLFSSSDDNGLCYIETAALDGETNLKVRQALPYTAEMKDDLQCISRFNATLICEPPNNRLSKFEGTLTCDNERYSIDNDKILLRGCVLRNTEWAFGMVIFAGKDTKLMMNSGKGVFKRTSIDRLMNLLIVGIFLFLMCICLLASIACITWEFFVGFESRVYLPDLNSDPKVYPRDIFPDSKKFGSLVIGGLYFFSYIIILNTVVPISLYVSVEVIRFTHSMWINWDGRMKYRINEKKEEWARARTTTLNEELGQIEYVFSDKTGTLTQNIMTFNKCSIQGNFYGDCYDSDNNPIDPAPHTPTVDFSKNPYYEKSFKFYDASLLAKVEDEDEQASLFFRLLALCHTVMPAEDALGNLLYEAQSPDEAALVSAARNFNFVFKSRTPKSITTIENKRKEEYELLQILDFDNVRKRMSVIVRKNGVITMYCKGADNMIFDRVNEASNALKEVTNEHLTRCAAEGLRTLCLSYRNIPEYEYQEWEKLWLDASTSMENRDEKMFEAMEKIEVEMTLIGATAIEDKLQDYVPETIANLARANIKIWVLTGDKQETAINIGYSCRLLTDDMAEVFVIEGEDKLSVKESLELARKRMDGPKSEWQGRVTSSSRAQLIGHHKNGDSPGRGSYSNNMLDASVSANNNRIINPEGTGYALVINGHSLTFALQEDMEELLFETATKCIAVICCRVTPLQKALVVEMVKNRKSAVTLAIGDGANDVSMIRAAHIGVGISGQEGLQAVMSSDFSIAQFSFLERLLLVHGRWSYVRMCKFLKYFFYKNFAFTLAHFWFAFLCGFSAQTVYDPAFIALYNLIFTSMPVLMLACFEQDVNDRYCIRYPKLYLAGQQNLLFNKKVFAQSVMQGIISSFIIFGIPFAAFSSQTDQFGIDLSDMRGVGVSVATCLIWGVTLQCALETQYWTWINHFFTWGSIILFMLFQIILYADKLTFLDFFYEYMGVTPQVMVSPGYWLCLLLALVVLLLPILALKFYYIRVRPTLADHLREQHNFNSKSRSDLKIRRSSHGRPRSSMRSGYAFSHKGGFGDLITSGQMSQRSRPASASAPGTSGVNGRF